MPVGRIVFNLAAVAAAGVLAGCGGGSGSAPSAAVTTTTTVSSTPPATTSSSASVSSTSTAGSQTSAAKTASTTNSSTATSSTATSSHVSSASTGSAAKTPNPAKGKLALISAAFPRGGSIPARYTCDGANVSPPLQWGRVPSGTAQLFLLALSLNAGPLGPIRWAVGGIDPASGGFGAGQLPAGAVVGRSSDGRDGWAGLCPARGQSQTLVVLVYALRNKVNLAPGFEPSAVQRGLSSNTVGTGVVYGAYRRP